LAARQDLASASDRRNSICEADRNTQFLNEAGRESARDDGGVASISLKHRERLRNAAGTGRILIASVFDSPE
jgi:hypothetical protein